MKPKYRVVPRLFGGFKIQIYKEVDAYPMSCIDDMLLPMPTVWEWVDCCEIEYEELVDKLNDLRS